jgi:hypothetical protein
MKTDVLHGIAVRPDAVDLTTLRQVKNRWEVKETRTVERVPPPAPAEGVMGAHPLVHDLEPVADELEGACSIALPARQVLLRVVDLPTPDPDEIEGMIELQVDKFSPFPVEHLIVSYEQLEASEHSTRVLIAAVQRRDVENLGDAFQDLGAALWHIDVDVLGWWHLLAEAPASADSGFQVTLLTQPDDTLLVVSQNGTPMLFRSLGDPHDTDRTGFIDAVAEEINYTLTSMEAEWGVATVPQVTVWHAEPDASDLVEGLGKVLGIPTQGVPLSQLPPLSQGLAQRAAERGPGMVNLAPPEWAADRDSRKWKRNLILASSILFAIWLVVVGSFLGVLGARKAGLAKVRAQAEALAGPAEEVRIIQEKIAFLEQYKDRTRSALEVLRGATLALPSEVELSAFIYKKNGKLTLRGEAAQQPPIIDFFQALQDDPIFGEVTPGKIQGSTRSGTTRMSFSVSADLSMGQEEPAP